MVLVLWGHVFQTNLVGRVVGACFGMLQELAEPITFRLVALLSALLAAVSKLAAHGQKPLCLYLAAALAVCWSPAMPSPCWP